MCPSLCLSLLLPYSLSYLEYVGTQVHNLMKFWYLTIFAVTLRSYVHIFYLLHVYR